MSVIDEVRAEREDLARVLKKYTGIRKIVEDLYPDRAHFIYELLQNAEDAGATEGRFKLEKSRVSFEHNGRPFDERDIWAITNIGGNDKADDVDTIGRFGVGFKAVFLYTETPHIWSPTYSFKISDLVLPSALSPRRELNQQTRFDFPFDNRKKDPNTAYAEVHSGLTELGETTLLFLPHLESLRWESDDAAPGEVLRIQHSENHFEVLKQTSGKTTSSAHFLKFEQAVEGLATQRLAIAFELDRLPNVGRFDPKEILAKQFKVSPAAPGRVAVFFPAEKESSGLRFHLHGPFVPELSRASIKETPANQPLFQQLAQLAAQCLHKIRDLGLLTVDFLSVLPNPQDQVPTRYHCIREAIISEMNTQPLTPTYSKSHAPAKHLLSARAVLKDLLSAKDVEFLVDYDEDPPVWAVAATQRNSNADRFLAALEIRDWDIDEFVKLLTDRSAVGRTRYLGTPPKLTTGPDPDFMKWLGGHDSEWHQRLYAMLFSELSGGSGCGRLRDLKIVRLSDGSYSAANKCFFPSAGVEQDDVLPRVDGNVYSLGRNRTQQENARRLLQEIGVREVGEAEEVEAILKRQYSSTDAKPRKGDLTRFIALVEKESESAALFEKHFIFEGNDGKWHRPSEMFLDEPFHHTGLSTYYAAVMNDVQCVPLADSYRRSGVEIKRLVKFAAAVGVKATLEIVKTSCYENPQWMYLSSVGGSMTTTSINLDYTIPHLAEALRTPTVELSRLVWTTLSSIPQYPNVLQATYQNNRSWGAHYGDSQLVHVLREAKWIPQSDDSFVRPSDASRDSLPGGFPFDASWRWLSAIKFGEEALRKSQEDRGKEQAAKDLGFPDSASLDRARRFASLPAEEQERILSAHLGEMDVELPDKEPTNPERRAARVAADARRAPARETEQRRRSVSVEREGVKQETEQYLRELYTNANGELICQICKKRMPFKLDSGVDYFEKVEFLVELEKRHYQNYLALCPNHAAMFQYANGTTDSMQEKLLSMTGNELSIVVAQTETTVYFTKTHLLDLRAIIQAESGLEGADGLGKDGEQSSAGANWQKSSERPTTEK